MELKALQIAYVVLWFVAWAVAWIGAVLCLVLGPRRHALVALVPPAATFGWILLFLGMMNQERGLFAQPFIVVVLEILLLAANVASAVVVNRAWIRAAVGRRRVRRSAPGRHHVVATGR